LSAFNFQFARGVGLYPAEGARSAETNIEVDVPERSAVPTELTVILTGQSNQLEPVTVEFDP